MSNPLLFTSTFLLPYYTMTPPRSMILTAVCEYYTYDER